MMRWKTGYGGCACSWSLLYFLFWSSNGYLTLVPLGSAMLGNPYLEFGAGWGWMTGDGDGDGDGDSDSDIHLPTWGSISRLSSSGVTPPCSWQRGEDCHLQPMDSVASPLRHTVGTVNFRFYLVNDWLPSCDFFLECSICDLFRR